MTAPSRAPQTTENGWTTSGWFPQGGPQTAAILTANFIDELLFGGARGGGKSDFLIGDFGQDVGQGYGSAWGGVLFRCSYPELEELISRSKEIYGPWFPGSVFKEQSKTWHFPDGATLKMRFMESPSDADAYQGHQYAWLGFDELGNFKSMAGYNKMKATLRSAVPIPCKRIRSSANPGGPNHHEVKHYFGIDRYPHGNEPLTDQDTKMMRMFIRSRVQDNTILMESDPRYVDRLRGTGSKELVKAWLDGDWDVVLGAYFDCWNSDKHVIRPFPLEPHWLRFRALDWGSAAPFSVGWWTALTEPYEHPNGYLIPKGALVRYREWYGASGPNKGLKLTAEQVADGIKEREASDPIANNKEPVHYSVADPSIFAKDGGPSIAERMGNRGIFFRGADNTRVGTRGAMGGWDQLRQRLLGEDRPMIYCFNTCTDSIRTIPALQHDENRPEDVDTTGEDHAGDEWRYACMSRPWLRGRPAEDKPIIGMESLTLNRLFKEAKRKRRR